MKKLILISLLSLLSPLTQAMGTDDPILGMVNIQQLETRGGSDGANPWVLEADAWLGTDLNKLWLKADVEWVNGNAEESELQLLYSRAIAPYWDLQVGWRGDLRPNPKRHWLALGIHGVAPYHFETDAALFVGKSGNVGARLTTEYEFMLTQRLRLIPEVSLNLYSKDDAEVGIGAGLSDINAGLRLGYDLSREFTPYIGVNYRRSFGNTADFLRDEGASTHDTQWVIGIRAWF